MDNAAANDFRGRNFAGSSVLAAPFTETASQNFTTVNGMTDTELKLPRFRGHPTFWVEGVHDVEAKSTLPT